jgi:hypothetical protein|tara:strand:+ start:3711 stop:4103 length:393 start_codon:yes stop_codon:yes gene_type:complete
MGYLKKEQVFFERDGEGKLLPIDATLESYDENTQISMIPMAKGEITDMASKSKSMETSPDMDVDIVIKHCVEPKFTEADRELLKSSSKIALLNAIVTAIVAESTGVSQKQLIEDGKKKVLSKELAELEKK